MKLWKDSLNLQNCLFIDRHDDGEKSLVYSKFRRKPQKAQEKASCFERKVFRVDYGTSLIFVINM